MELFITVKGRHRFLRGSSELAISRTETLQPAFNWVIHWLFGRQLSKNIGLIVSDGNKTYHAMVANEYKHVVQATDTAHDSPPIHVAAVGRRRR